MSWLIEQLRKHKDNRGMMANLRCILVDTKKPRAWPVLNRLGVRIDDSTSAFVAGLFATHPEETSDGNFGTTCNAIEQRRGDNRRDDKLTPTERRFQHLLSSEKGNELNGRVLRMVMMAKSQGVPVNYEQLIQDLKSWDDSREWKDSKIKWAASFWAQSSTEVSTEESA